MKDTNKKTIIVKCEANVCPICGSMNLAYGCSEDDDNGRKFPWTCEDCGATGKESYTETFDGNHYNVKNGAGLPIEIVNPIPCHPNNEKTAEDVTCPVCGGELEYTGKTGETKNSFCQEWRCTKCHAAGWAKFVEATDYIFTGEHSDVYLADGSEWDGEPIPAMESAEEKHQITGSITLLNDRLDKEDALRALKDANICASAENGQIVIKDTPVSKAVDILANEGILLQAIVFNGEACDQPATKTWKIPVTWEMCGYVHVDAATLEEAMDMVRCDNEDIPLPGDAYYVDGSFAPSYDDVEEVRSLHNNGEQDLEVAV